MSRRRRWGFASTATLLVAAVVAVGVGAPVGASSSGEPSPPHPAEWDPKVRDLARFVERERRLAFDHPVTVEFLDDAAFVASLAYEETAEERELSRLYAGDLYALGLVGPDLDLTAAVEALDATGISGYYDDELEIMRVRGQDLDDVVVRATVVHELTHALQAQAFDFDTLRDERASSGADFASSALIEGDATRVEEAYVATLSRRERDEYDAQYELVPESTTVTNPAVDLLLSTPYTLGYTFVEYLHSTGGNRAVDDAFRDPPPSDEQVVDPVAFVRAERPAAPPRPRLRAGESKRGGTDEIGVVLLYFTLAARLDPQVALAAATGWRGDRYLGFSREGIPCVRAAIATDGVDDAIELADAFETWAGAAPKGSVSTRRQRATVHLDACGAPEVPVPTEETLLDASDALSVRYLVYGGIEGVSPTLAPEQMRCLTDLQVTDVEIRRLLFTPELTAGEQRRLVRTIDRFAVRCGLDLQR